MKVVRFIIVFVLSLLLLFVATGLIVTVFYEDEAKQYIVAELNKNLESEVQVEEIEMSFLSTFPYISLEFTNISAKEAVIVIGVPDTLFFFERAWLQFNLLDILKKDYRIRKITAEEGFLRLHIDEEGHENWLIWKAKEKDPSFLLELEDLSVNGANISYISDRRNDHIAFRASSIHLNGKFYSEEFLMAIAGDLFVDKAVVGGVNYLNRHRLVLDTGLDVNKPVKSYTFHNGRFTIDGQMNFAVTGKITDRKEGNLLDLSIKGDQLDIVSSFALVPGRYRGPLKDYESDGLLDFACTVEGEMSATKSPAVNATFSIDNGTVQKRGSNYQLHEVHLTGTFTNGKKHNAATSAFDIENMTARLGEGSMETKFRVANLKHPHITASLIGEISLSSLQQFLEMDTLQEVSGNVTVNAEFDGKVKDLSKFSAQDFRRAKASGKITFRDVAFRVKNSTVKWHGLTGTLLLHDNDMLIKALEGNISSTDFRLSGLFRNMLAFLFLENESLTIEADFASDRLNLNEILGGDVSASDTAYTLAFSDRVNFNLNATIGRLDFRRFKAQNIRGVVQYRNGKLRAKPLTFETMEGRVQGSCEIEQAGKNYLITVNTTAKDIDINQLFYQFENFGQRVIQHRHLKGRATADVYFAGVMSNKLHFDPNKVYAEGTLTINHGEFIGFEPLGSIADYFSENKLLRGFVKHEELRLRLQHVHFSKLENRIVIEKQKVYIPQMDIHSDVMDIEIAGTHTFDNKIDYGLSFYLSDLLTKRGEVTETEFGYIKDDGLGRTRIFLKMTGTVDDPDISYDKAGLKKNIKKEIAKEKATIKSILKEELGLFKKDTTVKVLPEEKKEADFIMEWEEAEEPKPKDKKPDTTKKKKGFKKFLDKLKEKETEEAEFDFEEDDF